MAASNLSADDVEPLAKRILELDQRSQHLRNLLYFWTAAVALGLILEYKGDFVRLAQLLWLYATRRVPLEWWRVKKVLMLGGLLVTVGVVGELYIEFSQSNVETQLADHNGRLIGNLRQLARDALHDANTAAIQSGTAVTKAGEAADASKKALDESGRAENVAERARSEADSFEKDIGAAKREATSATVELNRIKSPRLLTEPSTMVAALRQFTGTEYAFPSVFQNSESLTLLQSIDSVLQLAEWKKVKGPPGFPAVNLYGKEDGFAVPIGFNVGIQISAEAAMDQSTALRLPLEQLPANIQAAAVLRTLLLSHLSPSATEQDVPKVYLKQGSSLTVSIAVGSKL